MEIEDKWSLERMILGLAEAYLGEVARGSNLSNKAYLDSKKINRIRKTLDEDFKQSTNSKLTPQ